MSLFVRRSCRNTLPGSFNMKQVTSIADRCRLCSNLAASISAYWIQKFQVETHIIGRPRIENRWGDLPSTTDPSGTSCLLPLHMCQKRVFSIWFLSHSWTAFEYALPCSILLRHGKVMSLKHPTNLFLLAGNLPGWLFQYRNIFTLRSCDREISLGKTIHRSMTSPAGESGLNILCQVPEYIEIKFAEMG